MIKTKKDKTHIIFCICGFGVIKKEPKIIKKREKKLKTKSRERNSENFVLFSFLRENSLVAMFVIPKSEKIAIIETKEIAKVNFPYSVTPKILTAKITKANPNNPVIASDKDNQRVFLKTVCFIPRLLKRKSFIFTLHPNKFIIL